MVDPEGMLQLVDVPSGPTLSDYAAHLHLAPLVGALRERAEKARPALDGRTVWMVSSTATGGGVAEMMPRLVAILEELGVRTRWAVIGSDQERFFTLTKRLHNLLHGAGDPALDGTDTAVYEAVSLANEEMLAEHVRPGDVVVAHDPQPAGGVALLRQKREVRAIWRCHIGWDRENAQTRAAWGFLSRWLDPYDRAIFSVGAYVPDSLRDRARIIPPAIDPLSHKNRDLHVHKLTGVLVAAELVPAFHPQVAPTFAVPARRLQPDGSFAAGTHPEDLGLLFRPVVTQVSRFDRLKGFLPLLRGFARLKQTTHERGSAIEPRHLARLQTLRLVLAGPDPRGVRDDPEGQEVLDELCAAWRAVHPDIQRDVAVLVLPMSSRKENALMVNAIQRCSTLVAQCSLREGFGLTAAEAMWKGVPVLGTSAAGLRAQIRPGVDGDLVDDPEDEEEIAAKLDAMLADAKARETWSDNARRRVAEEFLVFAQVQRWLDTLADAVSG